MTISNGTLARLMVVWIALIDSKPDRHSQGASAKGLVDRATNKRLVTLKAQCSVDISRTEVL